MNVESVCSVKRQLKQRYAHLSILCDALTQCFIKGFKTQAHFSGTTVTYKKRHKRALGGGYTLRRGACLLANNL